MARGFSSLFARRSAEPERDNAPDDLNAAAQHLFNLKRNALDMAKEIAASENTEPNLSHYFRAAQSIPGLQDNPAQTADLSRHTLDGFHIRLQDIRPNQEQRAAMRDVIGIKAMRNFHDLDGNGQIEVDAVDQYYAVIDGHLKLDHSNITNCTFQPATTLEILNNAVGARCGNITLDGLGADETLTIGKDSETRGANDRAHYGRVNVINAEGGTIRVGNAILDGITMNNGRTVLEVSAGGQVNQLNVSGETLALKMDPGAGLFLPQLHGVTFTPNSTMEGAIIRGDAMGGFHGFRDCSLNGMNLCGAALSGIEIQGGDMTGASLRGGRLSNVMLRDVHGLDTVDMTGMQVHNVSIMVGGVMKRADSVEQLQGYARAAAAVASVDVTSWAQATTQPAVEFHATPTTALLRGPAPLVAPDRPTEPSRPAGGGDQPVVAPVRFEVAHADLHQVLAQGAPQPETPEQRYAAAEARAAKVLGDGVSMRGV